MKVPFDIDAGPPGFGLIVLQADETLEPEFSRMIGSDLVRLHHSRIPMPPEVRPDTLAGMLDQIPQVAGLLPPGLRVIGYGCTSATSVIGPDRVARAIGAIHPGVPVSDPLSAIIAAGRHLGAGRLAFLSPYVADVTVHMRARLEDAGFTIAAMASFEEGDDRVVARIAPGSILDAAQRVAAEAEVAVDALVISCTNLRCLPMIARIEQATGVPVLSSNQALAWHMLRLAGVEPPNRPEFGQLFAGR